MQQFVAIVLVSTLIGILWVCIFPLLIYYQHKFWKNRSIDYIAKRRPILVAIIVISEMINLAMVRPIIVFLDILVFLPQPHHPYERSFSLLSTFIGWMPFLTILLFLLRFWFMLFDHQRNQHLLQRRWQSMLIKNKNSSKRTDIPWIIKYQRFLGNERLLLAMAVGFFVVAETSLMSTVVYGYRSIEHLLTRYIVQSFSFVLLFTMFGLAMRVKDSLGIRTEIIHLTVIVVLVGIPWTARSFMFSVSYANAVASWYLWTLLVVLVGFRMVIPTPPEKAKQFVCCIDLSKVPTVTQRHFTVMSLSSVSVSSATTDNTMHIADQTRQLLLKDVFMNEDGLNLFAVYLVNEYSVENILFLLQFKQLQLDILEMAKHKTQVLTPAMADTLFPLDVCPRVMAKLCAKHETMDDMLQYIQLLFDEYFDPSSMSQINVSFHTRTAIATLLANLSYDAHESNIDIDKGQYLREFYIAFELAAAEVFQLLSTDSLGRFRYTKQCKLWRQSLNNNVLLQI